MTEDEKRKLAADLGRRIGNALHVLGETQGQGIYEICDIHLNEARAHLDQAYRRATEAKGD